MGIFILTAIGLLGWLAVAAIGVALLVLWYAVEWVRQKLFERDTPVNVWKGSDE